MTRYQARQRARTMLDDYASRSDICSFLNDLADEKILSCRAVDALADILAADRGNGPSVLNSILSMIPTTNTDEQPIQLHQEPQA